MKPLAESTLKRCNFGERYWNARVEDYSGEKKEFVLQYAADIRRYVQLGEGLWLHGPPGTGKTHLLVALGIHARSQRLTVLFTTAFELRANILENKSFMEDPNSDWNKRAREVDILIIDDLGREYRAASGFNEKLVDLIMVDRYNARKPTWISTNIQGATELETRFGDAFASRVRGSCHELRFVEQDSFRDAEYDNRFSHKVKK